jgi:hypothetical protein
VAGVAALVFVLLTVIAVLLGGSPPAADDAVSKLRSYLVDHRTALLVSNFLGLLSLPLLLWFGAVFRQLVAVDRTDDALGTASLAGLLVAAPMALAGGAVMTSAIYVDGVADRLGDDTIRIVYEAQSLLFAATAAGFVLFAIAAGVAIARTRILPAYTVWLAGLAALGGIAAMISTLAAGAAILGLLGVVTFGLFVLGTAIAMAIGKVAPLQASATVSVQS